MRARLAIFIVCILLLACAIWYIRSPKPDRRSDSSPTTSTGPSASPAAIPNTPGSAPTAVYAHNLMLRKGADFRIYVRWLRGNMVRTRQGVNPTFDDPESFRLEIKNGVIRANIGDIGNFLNAGIVDSPLKNIKLLADNDQIKLTGTLHKLISMPVELLGSVSATSDNRLQVHVTKLSVLKVPLKGTFGGIAHQRRRSVSPQGYPWY